MAKHKRKPDHLPELPKGPVHRLLSPVTLFLRIEAASGVLLLAAAVAALILVNSPWSEAFLAFWRMPVGVTLGDYTITEKLQHWINDGLMVIFFFVIGLEVKRELVTGELRNPRQAAMPLAAALGGMVVPAGIYLAMQADGEGAKGWGIPMATDIAFVVGCLALLGSRVPQGFRVMLLSLAIVDDIGAILVIVAGYTDAIGWTALGLGAGGVALCLVMARVGVRSIPVYTMVGLLIWFAFHESGVHATLAGVILGLITPARSHIQVGMAGDIVEAVGRYFTGASAEPAITKLGALEHAHRAGRETVSPVERLETMLHPWVGFVILPIFALANAGVPIQITDFAEPVPVAVMVALLVGKPVGVLLTSWLAAKAGIASLPEGVSWTMLLAGGMLCGIGFTMSIFIAGLAFRSEVPLLNSAKVGVLTASLISAAAGMSLLLLSGRRRSTE